MGIRYCCMHKLIASKIEAAFKQRFGLHFPLWYWKLAKHFKSFNIASPPSDQSSDQEILEAAFLAKVLIANCLHKKAWEK